MRPSRLLFIILSVQLCSFLSGCAVDEQIGLCTELGTCTEDPEEKKAAADKKWWCEYYSGKNCGEDASTTSSQKTTEHDTTDHSESGDAGK